MITISTEWLRRSWTAFVSDGSLDLLLSNWDKGDALTEATLGPASSASQVVAKLILGERKAPNARVVIRFSEMPDEPSQLDSDWFRAPGGKCFRAVGESSLSGIRAEVPVQIVDISSALDERRTGLLETTLLAEESVLVFGLGTGGIHVALELAKSGVGRFVLVDPDRLDVGNVSRHHAGVSFSGRRKVYVARDLILEKNPLARVAAYSEAVVPETRNWAEGLVRESRIVVCATDARPSKLLVNSICVEQNIPAVYGGAFRRAYGGQVLRVIPSASPCYQCFVMALPDAENEMEVASQEDAEQIAYSDRPVPIEPGLSLDVAPISLMVAKLALQELVKGKDSTLRVLERDFSAPWYLWVNRPEPGTAYADWPPLSDSMDEMTIMRWYGVTLEREASCPACGDFAGSRKDLADSSDESLPEFPGDRPWHGLQREPRQGHGT